jgi:hypothetical protein
VHLDIILVNDQLDALFSMYIFHASTCYEQKVLIIRRIKLLYKHFMNLNTIYNHVFKTHVCNFRLSTYFQIVLYQIMYLHNLILLMMSACCLKHVEA